MFNDWIISKGCDLVISGPYNSRPDREISSERRVYLTFRFSVAVVQNCSTLITVVLLSRLQPRSNLRTADNWHRLSLLKPSVSSTEQRNVYFMKMTKS